MSSIYSNHRRQADVSQHQCVVPLHDICVCDLLDQVDVLAIAIEARTTCIQPVIV